MVSAISSLVSLDGDMGLRFGEDIGLGVMANMTSVTRSGPRHEALTQRGK